MAVLIPVLSIYKYIVLVLVVVSGMACIRTGCDRSNVIMLVPAVIRTSRRCVPVLLVPVMYWCRYQSVISTWVTGLCMFCSHDGMTQFIVSR